MPFNPLNNSEVRFVFPLKDGETVAERESEPKFVIADLVPFLPMGRWTETVPRVQVRAVRWGQEGATPQWVFSRTGPRAAFQFPSDPLSILITLSEATVLTLLSLSCISGHSLPYIWSWGQEICLLWVKVFLLGLWRFFFLEEACLQPSPTIAWARKSS